MSYYPAQFPRTSPFVVSEKKVCLCSLIIVRRNEGCTGTKLGLCDPLPFRQGAPSLHIDPVHDSRQLQQSTGMKFARQSGLAQLVRRFFCHKRKNYGGHPAHRRAGGSSLQLFTTVLLGICTNRPSILDAFQGSPLGVPVDEGEMTKRSQALRGSWGYPEGNCKK